jgi:pectinesterase
LLLVVLVPVVAARAEPLPPDRVVAADGSGDFRTIQAALDALPRDRRERQVILIKDGEYREKIRIDVPCVTLRGQSRKGTRIAFPQLSVDFDQSPDKIGRGVINIQADDVVLENLAAANTADTEGPRAGSLFGRHAFTVMGRGDRTLTLDCDFLSEGADTVALWEGRRGCYYHARCHFRGGVDFFCPRGWCYAADCTFDEVRATAALWHDGSQAKDKKLVIRRGSFRGAPDWWLGRHHRDAQFYLLDCNFAATMADRPIGRVHYPGDPKKEQQVTDAIRWGERCYYSNCHREGGDYAWHHDNLEQAEGAPRPEQITAAWTFEGRWNPEDASAPAVVKVDVAARDVNLSWAEDVTVKGRPRLRLKSGMTASYESGSGTRSLVFRSTAPGDQPVALELGDGLIVASLATVSLRRVDPALPRP